MRIAEAHGRRAGRGQWAVLGAALATVTILPTACVGTPGVAGEAGAPPSPREVWTPPAEARPSVPDSEANAAAAAEVPEDLAEEAQHLTLAQVVDLALRNNPSTQASWLQSKSAAAAYGVQRARLFPSISGEVSALTNKQVANTVRFGGQRNQVSPSLTLSYLLFDVGGRSGARDAAKEGLFAAGFNHDAVLQNVVLQAEQAYFGYMANRELLSAQQASVAEAEASLESAQHRHDVGLATIADVLQARTALSQARLAAETTQGTLQAARASLAVSMGLPANLPFDVAAPADSTPVGTVAEDVDSLIVRAVRNRPDLAAADARARQAQASARATRSQLFPSLSMSGNAGRVFSDVEQFTGGSYSLGLSLQVPLLNGFSRQYATQAAEATAGAARAQAQGVHQQVIQQVFTAYYTLQTATQRVHTSDDLLASAQQSEDVARGRYEEGVGTILDLLTAQRALADARAQQSQARWSWLLSLAQLAHDTGVLGTDGTPNIPVSSDSTSTPRR